MLVITMASPPPGGYASLSTRLQGRAASVVSKSSAAKRCAGLCGPDARRSWASLARLDVELDALSPLQGVEVHRAIQSRTMEEILDPV
ncbi:MAG TPA: hypothetical protein VIC57_19475, partial [Candidatus Dormibacteraeota bacterium]